MEIEEWKLYPGLQIINYFESVRAYTTRAYTLLTKDNGIKRIGVICESIKATLIFVFLYGEFGI